MNQEDKKAYELRGELLGLAGALSQFAAQMGYVRDCIIETGTGEVALDLLREERLRADLLDIVNALARVRRLRDDLQGNHDSYHPAGCVCDPMGPGQVGEEFDQGGKS